MREHPLPALPHNNQNRVQFDPRGEMDGQTRYENEHTNNLKKSGEMYSLFDDTSEIDLRTISLLDGDRYNLSAFLHAPKLREYPKTVSQKCSYPMAHDAHTRPSSATLSQGPKTEFDGRGGPHALAEQDNYLCLNCDSSTVPGLIRHASCDAVCDDVPDAAPDHQYDYGQPDAAPDHQYDYGQPDAAPDHQYDYGQPDADYVPPRYAPTGSDGEPHRETLVRFADAHTILFTPPPQNLPPTPPPHQNLSSSTSSSNPPLHSYSKPYGPRIPPWGSTEHLDHERRLRTDTRVLEDTLDEHFEKMERLRKAEEAWNMARRTEGEELRELVLGIYPELEEGTRERKCCLCAVM